MPSIRRHHRRDIDDTHWELLQSGESVVVHRHFLPFIGLLLYTAVWQVRSVSVGILRFNKIIAGRLSDILGRKGAMLLALSLFGKNTLELGGIYC